VGSMVSRYFLFFMFVTLLSFAESKVDQPSQEEEIRDTVVVHGMVLHGRVMDLGPERLTFKLLYSDGTNRIAYKDIESIYTKYNYHISFKRMDIEGRVVGIEDNTYLKIMEGDKERTVKISDIDNFVMAVSDDHSLENKIRNQFPYTKGNINMGFEVEDGNSKKQKANLLLNLKRKTAEHETMLYIDYAFETTQTADEPEVLNKDELLGILRYKNHFKNNHFYYASLMAEYDIPRQVQSRFAPSVGYGYKFNFDKSKWLEPSIGLAHTTTSYTQEQYQEKIFTAGALNLSGEYLLDDLAYINSLIVNGFVMYYPSLTDIKDDWILRSNLSLTVPLFDFLSVKFAINYTNDSNPDPSVGNNKTTTNLLFGFDF